MPLVIAHPKPDTACQPAPLADVARLLRDAACLARVAAWPDLRDGLVLIDPGDLPGIRGLAIGTGHALARWSCQPAGCVAALVAARSIAAETAGDLATAQLLIEHVALHEVAHLLTADTDTTQAIGPLMERVTRDGLPINPAVHREQHDARWAAALLIIIRRAARWRPHGDRLLRSMRADLVTHQHDPEQLMRRCARVSDDAHIVPLLARGGPLTCRLAEAGLLDHRPAPVALATAACVPPPGSAS